MEVEYSECQSASEKAEILELFRACDINGNGFITEKDLAELCSELKAEEINAVFQELDRNGDGKITVDDFEGSFDEIGDALISLSRIGTRRLSSAKSTSSIASECDKAMSRGNSIDTTNDNKSKEKTPEEKIEQARFSLTEFVSTLQEGYTLLNCQEHVCELYQGLHANEMPHLLAQFENIILAVIRDIRQHQIENDRLERSYKREKDQHSRHLRQMEEDLEIQIQKVESRIRKEEREKGELEKDEMRSQFEAEMKELQNNLVKLQQLDVKCNKSPDEDLKLSNTYLLEENRQLKSFLTDAQTNLAIVRSDLATVRTQSEESSDELTSQKASMMEVIREQDNLTRQVHLLQDANKKLHDINDDLRAALDTKATLASKNFSRPFSMHDRSRRHTITAIPKLDMERIHLAHRRVESGFEMDLLTGSSRCLSEEYGHEPDTVCSINDDMSVLGMFDPFSHRRILSLPTQESCECDSIHEDAGKTAIEHMEDSPIFPSTDSGHSTLRENHDVDSEYEPNSIDDDLPYSLPKRNQRRRRTIQSEESEVPESCDESDNGLRGINSGNDTEIETLTQSRTGSSASRSSRSSLKRSGSRRKLPTIPQRPLNSEPERMYKVVLAGDAAVGKSSFILRLCKNKFVSNLSSTLGVDFQTKTLEVDGRVVALQLWDTAGQERFRSIAKSYFRRADGVLLLYDCTYERSFINVRDWMDAIEMGTDKKIPIMLVGNKTDLRDEILHEEGSSTKGIVKYEDGQKLAKQYDALFIESSAKDGNHVQEACIEIARALRTHEDLEVKSVGMRLQEMDSSPKRSCACAKY